MQLRYGYAQYGGKGNAPGEEFPLHVLQGLDGLCTWLGGQTGEAEAFSGRLLVRMDVELPDDEWRGRLTFAEQLLTDDIDFAPEEHGEALAEWLLRKYREVVRGPNVVTFGQLCIMEDMWSEEPWLKVTTECRPGLCGADSEVGDSGAGLSVEVRSSEIFWVLLGEWDDYAKVDGALGRVLNFRTMGGIELLSEFVQKWGAACIMLSSREGLPLRVE
jgi:hypothetical protein